MRELSHMFYTTPHALVVALLAAHQNIAIRTPPTSGRHASIPLPCPLPRPGAYARATGGAMKGMGIGGMQRKERTRRGPMSRAEIIRPADMYLSTEGSPIWL